MKAIWNNKVIAQADKNDLIFMEGNWYFPPDSIEKSMLSPSNMHTTCYWKGQASYYDIDVEGQTNSAAAWYYPDLKPGAIETIGQDFTNYVGFWHGVQIED